MNTSINRSLGQTFLSANLRGRGKDQGLQPLHEEFKPVHACLDVWSRDSVVMNVSVTGLTDDGKTASSSTYHDLSRFPDAAQPTHPDFEEGKVYEALSSNEHWKSNISYENGVLTITETSSTFGPRWFGFLGQNGVNQEVLEIQTNKDFTEVGGVHLKETRTPKNLLGGFGNPTTIQDLTVDDLTAAPHTFVQIVNDVVSSSLQSGASETEVQKLTRGLLNKVIS